MKTQFAKHPRRASRAKHQPATSAAKIDVGVAVWNTLGAAKLLELSPARVLRAVASGQLSSSRRIIGGDGKPRFAFSHGDLREYAALLVTENAESDRERPGYARQRVHALEAINALTFAL